MKERERERERYELIITTPHPPHHYKKETEWMRNR